MFSLNYVLFDRRGILLSDWQVNTILLYHTDFDCSFILALGLG
jgi:hypothetical protein